MNNHPIIKIIAEMTAIATKISKQYFRNLELKQQIKDDFSVVTTADCQIEQEWRKIIFNNFPNHQIIGEEEESIINNNEFCWVLDPIDGTSSFVSGRASFGNLIALSYKGRVVLGVINQPINNELWLAVDNINSDWSNPDWQKLLLVQLGLSGSFNEIESGCWFNGNKVTANNKCTDYKEAIIYSTSSSYFQGNLQNILIEVAKSHRLQKTGGIYYGGDCYSYGLLASGFVDMVIDPALQIYDYAALIPIIKMAGGEITNFLGEEILISNNIHQKTNIIATANKDLLLSILPIISQY